MVEAKVLEFMRKAEQDPELGALVRAVIVDDKDQALAGLVRIAHREGYELDAAALEAGLNACARGALSDDELNAASGGTQYGETDWKFINQRASPFRAFLSLTNG